jgi:phosphoribosylanthranilate isomerase
MIRIKICGITNLKDARAAVVAGADWLGFIFYKKSPRFVSPAVVQSIVSRLPESIKKVGVFVDESAARVRMIADACGLDVLQFHGQEASTYLKRFKGYRVMKAVRVKNAASLKRAKASTADHLLFDAFDPKAMGGTGKVFDWDLLSEINKIKKPVFISGGLSADNVTALLERIRPFGVDVSSGVEKSPGKKDVRKMKRFIKTVRQATRSSL